MYTKYMTPSQFYANKLLNKKIQTDEKQFSLLPHLDALQKLIIKNQSISQKIKNLFRKPSANKGLYIWGGVGIGKTFMMDCFFESLPIKHKIRIHFHEFMLQMHERLNQLKGQKNPIKIIACDIAKQASVLCFDEFFVKDIADAMLLGGLINEIFKKNFYLITTSNIPPNRLYLHGLQRQNFMPTILQLEKCLDVVHLDSDKDYRTHFLKKEGLYYSPLDNVAQENMQKAFDLHTHSHVSSEPINICRRQIPVIKRCEDCVWFDFNDICGVPRSQADYLVLAKQYKTVLVSNLVKMNGNQLDLISCFVHMVDVFYDEKIRLILSAEVGSGQLYTDAKLQLEFERTQSRLQEMSSEHYYERKKGI